MSKIDKLYHEYDNATGCEEGSRMHVSLTPKLEEWVRNKVESGLYNNASEVVREALRLLHEHDEVQRLKRERLSKALVEGEESGPDEPFDMRGILAELDAEKRESVS
jgi:antitoxin ParD1/3/4